ncbi:MAG: phosphatase PAP2/dual specificity phosphatase family protein [Ahniella sp.]|nr:phosphatase PAP2/dual specificity phosphatase family protein [Ahniella sp.]
MIETADITKRPWRKAALWLAVLAPFFYLTYGVANFLAARRTDVGSFVFDWEHHIPFLDWTIFPYWSINAFYGLSLFLCRNLFELNRHARRLLTAQIIAVACFLIWPLRLSFERPPVDGAAGWMFEALTSFDQPFNQAPSLHIALLVILWDLYRRLLPQWAMPVLHGWSLLIAVSVLTTFQHHFIDLPTGAALGLFCLWAWPLDTDQPAPRYHGPITRRRGVLAVLYAIVAIVLLAIALVYPRQAMILAWPSLALALVAINYVWVGAHGFQKSSIGRTSIAARWLLAPYHWGAWVNRSLWTRGEPDAVEVQDGVFLGRWPTAQTREKFRHIIDLAAEFPSTTGGPPIAVIPCLDLVPLDTNQLRAAARAIESARQTTDPVLVCCALGYSRSASAVVAWLLTTRRCWNLEDACDRVRRVRPKIVLSVHQRHAMEPLASILMLTTQRCVSPRHAACAFRRCRSACRFLH